MTEQPLVSIGVLSYNRPDDLRIALDSVLAQTYANLDIIVSDNGSTVPGTVDVVREYAARDARIRAFCHEQNRGVHYNLQFVADQALGEYFCWLAGDDAYSPGFVTDCVAQLQARPDAVLASCMPHSLNTGAPLPMRYIPDTTGLPLAEKYLLLISHAFSDMNLFYYSLIRTGAVQKTRLHYKKLFGGDLLLLFELLPFGDFVVNRDRPGLLYNMHEGQISASPLRYKSILMPHATSFAERRAFFTAYVGYIAAIVWRRDALRLPERMRILRRILSEYVRSKRYHLVKYDLGLNGLIQRAKKLLKAGKA